MTEPAPSPRVFYKYTSARVAKIVLATRCLRYSSPLLFNDPFDVTQELRLNFDERGLYAALSERVAWLMEQGDATLVRHPVFGPLLRLAMAAGPDVRRAMARELREQAGSPTPGQAAALKELKDKWRSLVPTFRILCLSELNDVTSMWHHYADNYQGVVLGFSAVEQVDDSVFQMARPVVYQEAPSIAEANAWVGCLLGEGETRWQHLFLEYLYVKTPAWSNEKEWRIPVTGRRPGDSELFGDYPFHPRELTAIYFGPKCSEQDREDVLKLLVHGLEHVEAYQMDLDTPRARLVPRPVER